MRSVATAVDLAVQVLLDAVLAAEAEDVAPPALRSVLLLLVEVLVVLFFASVEWLTGWSIRGGRTGAVVLELVNAADLAALAVLTASLGLALPLARRLCAGVELVVDGDVLERVLATVLVLDLILFGVLVGATGTEAPFLITVGCLVVLFRRMDPDLDTDPVEDVSVVV